LDRAAANADRYRFVAESALNSIVVCRRLLSMTFKVSECRIVPLTVPVVGMESMLHKQLCGLRGRLCFSLKTLLAWTAVSCVLLAFPINRFRREKAAIEELNRLGVCLATASNGPEWLPEIVDKRCFRYVVAVNTHGVPMGRQGFGRTEFLPVRFEPKRPLSSLECFFFVEARKGGSPGNASRVTDAGLARLQEELSALQQP
jgi:hypothetical protein